MQRSCNNRCVPTFDPVDPCKALDSHKLAQHALQACFTAGSVRAVRFESAAVCALRAHGVPRGGSGLVVHCGWSSAHVAAVALGATVMPPEKLLQKGTFGCRVGGRHLTELCLKASTSLHTSSHSMAR